MIDHIYHYRFDAAGQCADSLVLAFPSEPEGYFYKAMVFWKMLQTKAIPLENSKDAKAYTSLLQRVSEISENRLRTDPEDIRAMFYYGGAQGFLGRYEGLKNNMFAAASFAKKGKNLFENILEKEPEIFDAYLATGVFNYYASMVPWYLKPVSWIFAISGSREDGIRDIERAATKGTLTKLEASEVLAFAYINQQEYQKAADLLTPLSNSFPENIEFNFGLALAHYKLKNWAQVVKHSTLVTQNYVDVHYGNTDAIGYGYFVKGIALLETGVHEEAIGCFNEVLRLNQPSSLISWAYAARGAAYQKLGNIPMVLADYDEVVKRNDNDQALQQVRERRKEFQSDGTGK